MQCDVSTKRTLTITFSNRSKREPAALGIFTQTPYSVKGSDTLDFAKVLKGRFVTLEILQTFGTMSLHILHNLFHFFYMFCCDLHYMPFVIPQIVCRKTCQYYTTISSKEISLSTDIIYENVPLYMYGAGIRSNGLP